MESLVCLLLENELDRPLSDWERLVVRECLDDHGLLDDARTRELRALLHRIVSADFTDDIVPLSFGYPDGSGGLTNLFLDLQAHIPQLSWDDYGEGIRASFPGCEVEFFYDREGGSGYCVRPHGEDLGPWLRGLHRS